MSTVKSMDMISKNQTFQMAVLLGMVFLLAMTNVYAETESPYASPLAMVAGKDGQSLFVAEYTGHALAVVDLAKGVVTRRISLPTEVGGVALLPDGVTACVTGAVPDGCVYFVDTVSGEVGATVHVGHTPMSPVISTDGATAYICNRFSNDISVVDVTMKKETTRIPVLREPVSAAATPAGSLLFVANLLPSGPSNGDYTAAAISVIDTISKGEATTIALPNGASGVRGICVSPDGKFAYAVHILARYQLPTTQLERGWMNTNALTIIDVAKCERVNTVLLDDIDLGAPNPWAVTCTPDGAYLCITHAGSHELSIIDRPALHAKLEKAAAGQHVSEVTSNATNVPSDLSFLTGLRRRVKLNGNGPRALVLADGKAYAGEYFSDTISVVSLAEGNDAKVNTIALGAGTALSTSRRGEMLFNDAALCFQQWQSCASCHPDARMDALNWDLLNDGVGNPKNTRSMLLSHATPPVMSLGVRDRAETAVRSGIKYIQFAIRPDTDAAAIDDYLKGMKPVVSPYRLNGELSPKAQKGKDIFQRAGCAVCHPAPLFTDLKRYDLGTTTGMDVGKPVDTPTLIEVWRTAPYLHDGRAATLEDLFKKFNDDERHTKISNLTDEEFQQLLEYVLSL